MSALAGPGNCEMPYSKGVPGFVVHHLYGHGMPLPKASRHRISVNGQCYRYIRSKDNSCIVFATVDAFCYASVLFSIVILKLKRLKISGHSPAMLCGWVAQGGVAPDSSTCIYG
jgi:hypothetical protein